MGCVCVCVLGIKEIGRGEEKERNKVSGVLKKNKLLTIRFAFKEEGVRTPCRVPLCRLF